MPSQMTAATPRYRKDYQEPHHWVREVALVFDLGEEETLVRSKMQIEGKSTESLYLDGIGLEARGFWLDGRELSEGEWEACEGGVRIHDVPERFELETLVAIKPQENSSLMGLYKSSGNFCTQCEAEGFRKITWFVDRPDNMARFSVTMRADKDRYPVLLSNGNRGECRDLEDGRHEACWEDPYLKPSYLFALVAGDLRCHSGSFTTRSGREVGLEIWVEPQNIDRCQHALESLQKSMAWDEKRFGLEYDLDLYMIVAVNDFNMGAMENKGLNIFNSKYVLALPETATDGDYESIEAVIGHEYFHNWTGNRVTCRDWFQLTLKEGLTVYRDQEFTSDQRSRPVKRIDDVKMLRLAQFPEDAGPMAHPIRPESYIEMNNFYTSTVYNKGAEVIRMYETLLGRDGFRKGIDLYFERHDGHAVTCDDFRAAMADANDADLEQFENWYLQSGTPTIHVDEAFVEGVYELTLTQSIPTREGQEDPVPMHIPVRMGLLGSDGSALPLRLQGTEGDGSPTELTLELREATQVFRFEGLEEKPIASLFRGFSAPVRLEFERSRDELAFLMAHDRDAFNRWEAGQDLMMAMLLERIEKGEDWKVDPLFLEAWGKLLRDDSLDGSLKALALQLPAERVVAQEMEVVDPDAIHSASQALRECLLDAHGKTLLEIYECNRGDGSYSNDKKSIDARRLKNLCLGFLLARGGQEALSLAETQFQAANNMTDSQAALAGLADHVSPASEAALSQFHARWSGDPLVLDKWFTVQALSSAPDTFDQVVKLSTHKDFTLDNPNRARSLIGAFSMGNQVHFHRKDGKAYTFIADQVLAMDKRNPQVASRLVSCFNSWKRFDKERQALMLTELRRIHSTENLSKDVTEIVERALAQAQ